jgi:hypothetical protein
MSATKYKVAQGEGIKKVAKKHGFSSWETLWNDPGNEELRKKRKNPGVLHPGDLIFVPEKQAKHVHGTTEIRHRFVCKLPKMTEMLRIKVEDFDGTALTNKPFILTLDDGTQLSETTNNEGMLEVAVPLEAQSGRLEIEGNEWPLEFDYLNPVDEPTSDNSVSGAQARLDNLGFPCPQSGVLDDATRTAIKAFQESHDGLRVSGELDDATRKALRERHGS